MADRFPSIEDFNGEDTTTHNIEPAATTGEDFLTRERAALGADATQFASGNDSAAFLDDDDDLLGGGGGGGGGGEEIKEFQSSFPAIDTRNENVAPGGTITSSNYQSTYISDNEPEPEVLRQWRERRDLSLQERAEKSGQKKAETIKNAQQNIDDFYDNYNSKKEKTIVSTKREAEEFLQNREDTSSGGTSWERIAKLVDLTGKGVKGGAAGTGKERFRELLMGLRKDEKAPGATGY